MSRSELIEAFALVELKRRTTETAAFTVSNVLDWVLKDSEFDEPVLNLEEEEVEAALRALARKQVLRAYNSARARIRFTANHSALEQEFASRSQDPDDAVHRYAVLGVYWLAEELGEQTFQTNSSGEQVGDDGWEPLPIDRESPKYDEAMTALQTAYESYRADNGYAATHPNERNTVVASLQAGLEWLKSKNEIPRRLLTSLILDPLRRGIERFKDAVPGALAKTAVDFIMKLFGL